MGIGLLDRGGGYTFMWSEIGRQFFLRLSLERNTEPAEELIKDILLF